jgi:hypothetical protein
MKKTVEQLSSNPFFDKVNERPKDRKLSSIQLAERKFQEAHLNLVTTNKGNTNLAITLIC